jgi:hypothetical protein
VNEDVWRRAARPAGWATSVTGATGMAPAALHTAAAAIAIAIAVASPKTEARTDWVTVEFSEAGMPKLRPS